MINNKSSSTTFFQFNNFSKYFEVAQSIRQSVSFKHYLHFHSFFTNFVIFQVSNISDKMINKASTHDPQQTATSSLTQHVDRLHKRATQQQLTLQQQQHQTRQANKVSQSVTSAFVNSCHQSNFGQASISRRASDPVRPLDRNFAAGAATETRSYAALHPPSAQAAKAAENQPESQLMSQGMQQLQQVGGFASKNVNTSSIDPTINMHSFIFIIIFIYYLNMQNSPAF
jgi:hypothetical protein